MTLLLQGGGGPGRIVQPSDLALAVWYKPEAWAAQADNSAQTTWADSSGNGRNASRTVSNPIVKKAIIDGRDVLRFDGVSNEVHAAFTLAQPFTLHLVGKYITLTGGGAQEYLCDGNLAGGDSMDIFQINGVCTAYGGASLAAGSPGTTFHYYAITFDGANSTVRRDGVVVSTGNIGTRSPGGIWLAASQGGNSAFTANCDLAEVAIATGAYTPLNNYFASRYPSLLIP
jgi:hypothetical protein